MKRDPLSEISDLLGRVHILTDVLLPSSGETESTDSPSMHALTEVATRARRLATPEAGPSLQSRILLQQIAGKLERLARQDLGER